MLSQWEMLVCPLLWRFCLQNVLDPLQTIRWQWPECVFLYLSVGFTSVFNVSA